MASSSNSAALRALINRCRASPCWINGTSRRGEPSSENAGLSEPLTCSVKLTSGLSRASPLYRRCRALLPVARACAEKPPQHSMPAISSMAAGAR
ncbi:hypothetical protein D3C75_732890 [compost metagenome]